MNRLSVTIVDLLGLLVPGAVFSLGCLFLPPSLAPIPALTLLLNSEAAIWANPWASGGAWLAAAYVVGFLLRQISIPLMQTITKTSWTTKLANEFQMLQEALELSINDQKITKSLQKLAATLSDTDPGRFAPYFSFTRRLLRNHPNLWAESERLEAELRFLSGLFIPFVLLFLGGLLRLPNHNSGWTLVSVGAIGAAIVAYSFPKRRIKEVRHNHYLALVALNNSGSKTRQGMKIPLPKRPLE